MRKRGKMGGAGSTVTPSRYRPNHQDHEEIKMAAYKHKPIPFTDHKLRDYFNARVLRGEPDACWLWQSTAFANGYPLCCYGGNLLATRVSYGLHYQEDPGPLFVCHRCDTPLCVNPNHLFLGTARDNMLDMKAKGRARYNTDPRPESRGESNPTAKLSNASAAQIRILARSQSMYSIAKAIGMSSTGVAAIIKGDTYGNVDTVAFTEPLVRGLVTPTQGTSKVHIFRGEQGRPICGCELSYLPVDFSVDSLTTAKHHCGRCVKMMPSLDTKRAA
jgi:hypothetical protein